MLIASHELDHTRGLAAREVVLTAGQAHLDPRPDERAVDEATEERSPLASERADAVTPPDRPTRVARERKARSAVRSPASERRW